MEGVIQGHGIRLYKNSRQPWTVNSIRILLIHYQLRAQDSGSYKRSIKHST